MKNEITRIEIYMISTNDGNRWMYELSVNRTALPQLPLAYYSLEDAFEAANEEARNYVPKPKGRPWQEQLAELEKKFGYLE